jgi:hypothetical protein
VAGVLGDRQHRSRSGESDPSRDLAELIVAYLKQETIGPGKSLLRWVRYGVVGSLLISVGIGLVLLGILRFLQEGVGGALSGSSSWLQYFITLIVAAIIGAVSAKAIVKVKARKR